MAIRDLLKAEGYRWDNKLKTWYIMRPVEGFSIKDFANQSSWSDSAAGIEVQFCDDLDNEIARYNVDRGKWRCISGDIPEMQVVFQLTTNCYCMLNAHTHGKTYPLIRNRQLRITAHGKSFHSRQIHMKR